MNGQSKSTERPTQSRWGTIPSVAARGDGVGCIQVVDWAPDQAADRHSHATERRQRQQRAVAGLLAVPVGGSGVDFQRPVEACPGRLTGTRPDLLHQARQLSKDHQLVRRDLGTVTPSSRHGLRPSVFAARRVFAVAKRNCTLLYGSRTYKAVHRNGNRTRERNHRNGNRTYGESNHSFLGTETVHHLDMPSVVTFCGGICRGLFRWEGSKWLLT